MSWTTPPKYTKLWSRTSSESLFSLPRLETRFPNAMSRLSQPGERMSGGGGRHEIQLEWKNGAAFVQCFVEREKKIKDVDNSK